MRETTFTNTAAETAEGSLYPEATLVYTEETSAVRKIAVFLPVTDEQLADVSGMQDRLNNRLLLMLRQRLDAQMVAGDGSPPNLRGILNTGSVLTVAQGADPNVDAVFKAIVKVQSTGFSEPNAVLLHPLNWQAMRLLKTTTGVYLFGYPGDPGVARLWGLPVVTSTYVTLNTGIVGDFNGYTELAFKAGIEFEVSNSHSDYFARGQLAIRAQFRVAWVITRPEALCSVTSLS
jgi:HK97 family phage major capsid protein